RVHTILKSKSTNLSPIVVGQNPSPCGQERICCFVKAPRGSLSHELDSCVLLRAVILSSRLGSISPHERNECKPELITDVFKAQANCFRPAKCRTGNQAADGFHSFAKRL